MFANLVNMKVNEGLHVDIIDITNEPDLGSKTFPYKRQGPTAPP